MIILSSGNTIANRYVFVVLSAIIISNQIKHVLSSEVLSSSSSSSSDTKLFCLHPMYPCYYYPCSYLSLGFDLNKVYAYKCQNGFIFDEASQRCTWVLPWQNCKEDEISKNIKVLKDNTIATITSNSAEFKFNNIVAQAIANQNNDENKNEINDELKYANKNEQQQEQQQPNQPKPQPTIKDITRDYLINVISNFGKGSLAPRNNVTSFKTETNKINLTYLSINEANLNLKTQKVMFHEDLTDLHQLPKRINKQRLNLVNTTNEFDEINEKKNDIPDTRMSSLISRPDESLIDGGSSEEYAFIIVPIKVNKDSNNHNKIANNKITAEIATPASTETTESTDDENLKSLQNMFQYKKVCYVTNWSQYRPKNGGYFTPEYIDPFLCTHIIYAFAYIDNVTLTIRTVEENDEELYRKLNDLKFKNPKLKTMLGVGGWNMESDEFSAMVKEKKTRLVFIYHAIKFLRHHGFDGLDLDWEFPADRGGVAEDKQRFTLFVHELRQAVNDEILEKNHEKLILSAAVAAGKDRVDKGYEVPQLAADLDFINLMTFDYHGSWDPKTGLNAPLYSHENETGNDSMLNQDWSISYWISHGCPPHKLVLGVPAYGRTFTLKDEKDNGIGATSVGSGKIGNYTKTPGFMSYYECCALRKTKDWTTVWLSQSKSHYMFNHNQWISFDDIKSFHIRTAYVVAKKLGGLFIWSLDMDDFTGKFCDMGAYPLVKNSMSLLMDYMPEFYSSNVNPAPKKDVKSVKSDREPSGMIYLLKEDDETNPAISSSPSTLPKSLLNGITSSNQNIDQNTNKIKKQIQKDLLLLLKQQPQKFLSYNLVEKFNCTNKLNGIHRDPLNCDKYYICNNKSSIDTNVNSDEIKVQKNIEYMKSFTCPTNTRFNMNGCFCDKNMNDGATSTCNYLSDTLCKQINF